MADESDYTDVTEEEAPARPATKSPFDSAPEVKPEKTKSKSRSRHRRRRRKHRSHRSKSRCEARRGRSERREKDRSSHVVRRGDSKVPEPLMPPKLSRAEKEEKKARKGQKGPNKGGKGGGKASKSSFWLCKECGQKTAPHTAAMEQHQYLNERCLSHQFWYKMTKKAQEESGSWYRAQQMARSTKFQRQTEAAEAGWEVPEEDERSKSPLWSAQSWHRSPARSESAPSGSAGSWKDRRAPAEPEMAHLVPAQSQAKTKKKADKESSDSEPEPEDSSKKGKKRRPVVTNIH